MDTLDHIVKIIEQVGFPAALVLMMVVLAPRYALRLLEVFRKIMDDFAGKLVTGIHQVVERHEAVINRAEAITSRQEAAVSRLEAISQVRWRNGRTGMGNPEWTPAVWQDETALIKIAAAKYGLDWHFVAAIRKAEGGAPGWEFGVLSVKAPTYAAQLEVCCQTVRHRLIQYDQDNQALELHEAPDGSQAVIYGRDFISWFAGIWAPNGASNDPDGLNGNWSRNVSYWYLHLMDLDHPA